MSDVRLSIITVRVNQDEKEHIQKQADNAGLSVSQLFRAVFAHSKVPESSNADAVKALYKANADMARIGNMFKGLLDSGDYNSDTIDDFINKLTAERNKIKDIALQMSKK